LRTGFVDPADQLVRPSRLADHRLRIDRTPDRGSAVLELVENQQVGHGRSIQRTVLYLGEINDSQRLQWCRAIEAVDEGEARQLHLFADDATVPEALSGSSLRLCLSQLELSRPSQWGGCWLALQLWNWLGLDRFWSSRLRPSRKGTKWLDVLKTLVCYRLLSPSSEWRLSPPS